MSTTAKEKLFWTILISLGVLGLFGRELAYQVLRDPQKKSEHVLAQPWGRVIENVKTTPEASPEPRVILLKTLGLWVAVFFTLSVLSYLWGDNPCYKLAEAVVVGVSAAYNMVVLFWDAIVKILFAKLAAGFQPSENELFWEHLGKHLQEASYLIPLLLGCLLFCRLIPNLEWLAQWPLAFVIGTTAGLRLVLILDADLVNQVRNTILPLIVVADGKIQFWLSLKNIALVAGVLSSLTYFFFSVPHRGWIGKVSRVGVWVLMITFGASFAFTVMGRITLLTLRLEFLLGTWLGLIPR